MRVQIIPLNEICKQSFLCDMAQHDWPLLILQSIRSLAQHLNGLVQCTLLASLAAGYQSSSETLHLPSSTCLDLLCDLVCCDGTAVHI